ncbi:MAG: hypothetical protein JNN11_04545 [Candidatus Doudnabacteria bacterium]|nr:hypothetical protein [Candidatus Doudnabacteria bacterium]
MNFQLIEKLRKLVEDSSILSLSEKHEWMSLLELMNDKQLLELERILVTNTLQVAANVVGAPVVRSQENFPKVALMQKSQPEKIVAPAPKFSMPAAILAAKEKKDVQPSRSKISLGHIINLPKIENAKKSILNNTLAKPEPELLKKSGFLSKLKAMVRQPELPPGHVLPELEITEKSSFKEQAVQIEKAPLVLKEKVLPPVKPLPVPVPAAPVKKPQPQEARLESVKSKENKAPALVPRNGIKDWPSHYDLRSRNLNVSSGPVLPVKKVLLPNEHVNLSVPKVTGALGTENVKKVSLSPSEIKRPEDLQGLGADALNTDIQAKLKEMVRHVGYFQVVPYLEKSPLYLNYLATGKQILEKNVSFETLSRENSNFLNHEQFEKTADLLRIIQAE